MEEFHRSNLCDNKICELILVLVDDNLIPGKICLFSFFILKEAVWSMKYYSALKNKEI